MVAWVLLLALIMLPTMFPTASYALGDKSIGEQMTDAGISRDADKIIQADSLSTAVRPILNAFAGIAVALFVLRIALTAIDRFALSRSTNPFPFRLSSIPVIGAYPDPNDIQKLDEQDMLAKKIKGDNSRPYLWTWAVIWKHFAVQIIVLSGAWVIANVLLQILIAVTSL